MKKIFFILFFCFLFALQALSKDFKSDIQDDYIYTNEYFDYLIECAQKEKNAVFEETKNENEADIFEFSEEPEIIDVISEEHTPFHLKIKKDVSILPYKDSFKKIDSKTIIPISNKVSFVQNMSKTRNKYNSNDYKILAGAEYQPFKFLNISSGLETNFRGLDQNPTSRKLYFSPSLNYKDKISLGFYNKMNVLDFSSDHDIGLNISPFKSKVMDFGVYSGLTKAKNGTITESINFLTNFYF